MMSTGSTIELAGYQGSESILSTSLLELARLLEHSRQFDTIQTTLDVTMHGETAAQLFESVNSGKRQLCYVASGYLTAHAPDLAVLDLPFTVADRAQALQALDLTAGRLLSRALALQSHYRVLGFWDNGFRHISNGIRPLLAPEDRQGLTIRTLDSAIYRESLDALGFKAVTTDVSDLMRVIRSGEVQAQENPLTNYNNFKIYQHHPYLSLTGHFFGVLLLVCHQPWFTSLSSRQQHALQEAATLVTQQQRLRAAQQDLELQTTLSQQGVKIVLASALDLPEMRDATVYIVERERHKLSRLIVQHYLDALTSSS